MIEKDLMRNSINKIISAEVARREEAIKAFIAANGCSPDALIQEIGPDGSWKIRLLRREEMYLKPAWWRRLWWWICSRFHTSEKQS